MDRQAARQRLLQTIARECSFTASLTGVDAFSPEVLAAIEKVPREQFVPRDFVGHAYDDNPLPIGLGQTISQPFIVALMTELLRPRPDQTMLEVGTGSGYQAAVLATLVHRLYSVEILPELAESASQRLARLGYDNVEVLLGDGRQGFRRHAPYDGIIVTAAGRQLPPALMAQLKPGGRLVIPVGPQRGIQHLLLLTRDDRGKCISRQVLGVAFVPLTGGEASRNSHA